ncbi:MAG TPA: Crp/Fnr family transcriptional regulator [Thermomicrobiaceae bacterium]|nr:Crp/Fnr family transcriptional regulator [Thermomicrobiaceae bacterium]
MATDNVSDAAWSAERRRAFLASAPLFRDLTAGTLAAVAAQVQARRFPDGAFVFLAGTPAEAVNLLAAGRIKVIRETEAGQEVILRMIQPGELFGGAGGWGEARYPASAVALDDAVVLRLPARTFTALTAAYPDFAQAVIHQLAERLRLAERRIEELQTQRVERRIANTLLRLADRAGVKTSEGIRIDLPLSRQDLADLAGTTLSTASRTLSGWDQRGLIAAGRERVTILRPHDLVAIADDIVPPEPD